MADGPTSTASKRKAPSSGKPSGSDGSKPEESVNPKAQAKFGSSSNAGASTQQPEPQTFGGATQQSTQAGASSETQQSGRKTTAQHGTDAENPQSGSSSQGDTGANLEITKQCEDLVESFRRGQMAKGAAVMAIGTALRGATHEGAHDDTVEAVFESYVTQLDEVSEYRESNRPNESRNLTPGRDADNSAARNRSQTRGRSKGKRRAAPSRSRSTSRSHFPDENASDTFSEDARPASKKQKQDPTIFAWESWANQVAESTLCPELKETLRLIRNHDFDIKTARSSLRNSVGVPEFPESEWTNVLLGKYVDLNHVLSGQYTLHQDERTVQKLGLIELTYRTVTPSRTVNSVGDWVTAWQRTTAAILYVFPHRRQELDSYCSHILKLFGSILLQHHDRVINYDRAVCKRAGSMHTLLLSDVDKFNDLRERFCNSLGVAASFTEEEGRKRNTGRRWPRDKEDEVCRRWNRGACDAGAAGCKFVHRCSLCGAADHPLTRCTKNPRSKA